MPDVDGVVVHYATPELTCEAVHSLLSQPEIGRVWVVDNASPDGSGALLAQRFAAARVAVLQQPRNLGFGGACNVAARSAAARYLFFLNSDARAEPACAGVLRQRLEGEARTGIVAPDVRQAGSGARQHDTQGDLPGAWEIVTRRTRCHRDTENPGWVSGVAFMARREEFLALGGFDESFFLYFEDVDLCRRYRLQGFEIARELGARVVHHGGRSQRSRRLQKRDYDASQDRYLEILGSPRAVRLLVRVLRRAYRLLSWA